MLVLIKYIICIPLVSLIIVASFIISLITWDAKYTQLSTSIGDYLFIGEIYQDNIK